jgi:hypothetical protein
MPGDPPVVLHLELTCGAPAPAGRLVDVHGEAVAFESWLELLTALHRALAATDTS